MTAAESSEKARKDFMAADKKNDWNDEFAVQLTQMLCLMLLGALFIVLYAIISLLLTCRDMLSGSN